MRLFFYLVFAGLGAAALAWLAVKAMTSELGLSMYGGPIIFAMCFTAFWVNLLRTDLRHRRGY